MSENVLDAIEKHNFEYIQRVINTTNANEPIDGTCPFRYAVRVGASEICEHFISQGFDIPVRNFSMNGSPLSTACYWGHFDCAKIILEAFPYCINETDCHCENALHDLCRMSFFPPNGNSGLVFCQIGALLLSAGVDLEMRNRSERTPLVMLMSRYGDRDVKKHNHLRAVRFLLYNGAKLPNVDSCPYLAPSVLTFAQQYLENEKTICGWLLTCRHSQHVKRIIGKDMIRLVAEEIFKINLDL